MRKTLGIIVALVFTTIINVQAQRKSLDKVAAVVGGSIVLQSDIEMQYAQYLAQGNPEDPDVKCIILQQILA